MIWATVSSWSCFCWLYRASPFLAAKNIINLISMLTIWWRPCVVFSCVVGKGCLLWQVQSLCQTLLAFALLHSVLQGQICLLLQVFLDPTFAFQSPIMKRTFWGDVSSKRSCRDSVKLSHPMWGHPRWRGHSREVWQNMVHWRKEWQTTSVFLPWEPHERYKKAKW